MGVKADHSSLDIVESGTWEELASAHRDLLPGPNSPSGFANLFGTIPFAFPASRPIRGLCGISDALVGAVRWDCPAVILEQEILLSSDDEARSTFVQQWAAKAASVMMDAYAQLWEVEKGLFRDVSFVAAGGQDPLPPFDPVPDMMDVDEDEDEEGDEGDSDEDGEDEEDEDEEDEEDQEEEEGDGEEL